MYFYTVYPEYNLASLHSPSPVPPPLPSHSRLPSLYLIRKQSICGIIIKYDKMKQKETNRRKGAQEEA